MFELSTGLGTILNHWSGNESVLYLCPNQASLLTVRVVSFPMLHVHEVISDITPSSAFGCHGTIVSLSESDSLQYYSCHGIVEYLQLVRSRYLQPTDGCAVGESWCNSCNFDFEQLQKEVIKTFVVGKPRIHSPSKHLRRHFNFRSVPQADTVSLDIAETNLGGIKQYITDKPKFTSKVGCCTYASNTQL